ncbi:MAG TPA: hypothetical protein VK666_21350 [Chryseolinea sp.]|nr:hypothetical protein [Chryseolinea sp.]
MDTCTMTTQVGSTVNNSQFEELYKVVFPKIAGFISKLHGTLQDSKDIFHDALIIYMERSQGPYNETVATPERYILGIAKHLWLKKFKKDRRTISLDAYESTLSIPDDFYATVRTRQLLRFLETTGRKCIDLLRDFYYERSTMKDIVSKHGYSNEHSATVQKYKCLEKIRQTVKDKSMTYEDFFE